jgi:hypothetical protein
MASAQQIAANRMNAQHSTGPRTSEGRNRSSLNALTHGLFASEALMPLEDADSFQDLVASLTGQLKPVGAIEEHLVDRLISIVWRLRRILRLEAEVLTHRFNTTIADRAAAEAKSYEISPLRAVLAENDKTTITDEERHWEAVQRGAEAEKRLLSDENALGEAFIKDSDASNALTKLARYETWMERRMFRTLHELQRLQAARHGRPSPLPLAVDVDVEVTAPSST